MKTFVLLICIALLLSTCNKPADETPPVIKPTSSDSTSVLKYSSGINYTYDNHFKRYINFYYTGSYFDSTFLNYDDKGLLKNMIRKTRTLSGYDAWITIFTYDNMGRPRKVFTKGPADKGEDTPAFIADTTRYISCYDSLKYDGKNRLVSYYRIQKPDDKAPEISSYGDFYYAPDNDSLLAKLEYYDRINTGALVLQTVYSFSRFDNKPNPFRAILPPPLSLLPLMTTPIKIIPSDLTPGYVLNGLLAFNIHNCTSPASRSVDPAGGSISNDIVYSYTVDSLPEKAMFKYGTIYSPFIKYEYIKVPK